ncbi:MAG: ion transporter [Pyrinomonadaceae bacterium]|nr:ion transporter [Pyrinomonadaceae bacterium]
MSESTSAPKLTLFQCVILVLSIYVLAALFIQTVFPLSPETNQLIDRIDFVICLIFIYDFFLRFYRAQSKASFLKWGWIDLISSIPMFDFMRWGRLVRVIRILRILRAFRSTKLLLGHLFRNRARGTFATVAMISIVMVIFSSIAILNLEDQPESNIKTPSDALWWSFVTITTVGYGDKFPITNEGRIIAAVLMTAGVGLFGTFTGFVASFFMEVEQQKEESQIQELIEEVRLLREKIERLENKP